VVRAQGCPDPGLSKERVDVDTLKQKQWADQQVDEDFVRRAVDLAESNALRVALYQATGDPEVRDLEQITVHLRRGALVKQVISDADLPTLKEKAVQFLLENADSYQETIPSDEELKSLMSLILGQEISDSYLASRKALVGFEEFPFYPAQWTGATKPELPQDFKVAIIGSGFSGISTGVILSRLGIPFDVYERRSEVGGTWSINRYPDVRVDTMSTTYQLSFVKKYPWPEYFAPAAQVRQYIEDTARDFGVLDNVKFGHDVRSLTWNEESSLWEIEVEHDGVVSRSTANYVVAGTGLFATPKKLDVAGVDDFKGDILHTALWPEDYPLEGKRVAVIGNGSTGVQLLKKVASEAAHVSAIVRTPQWVTPREYYGEPVPSELQWLLQKMPYYWNWDRFAWSAPNSLNDLFTPDPEWKAQGGLFSRMNDNLRTALTEYIKEQTGYDESLYSKLIPNYPPWARRMIVDNDWYKTLTEDHVDLVTDGIDHLEADGIVTTTGERIPVDVIVSSTGFTVTKYLFPITVTGKDGVSLEERWERDGVGPRAYLSMLVPGFPNLFILYGPNSQGSLNFPTKMETWANYVGEMLVRMVEQGHKSFDLTEKAFADHYEILDGRTSNMIWMDPDSRDKNYYVSHGRVQVMTAFSIEEHWRDMTTPRLEDFRLG